MPGFNALSGDQSWYDSGMTPAPPQGQFPASSSVDWLRRYLPQWAGNALAGREQQALAPTRPSEVAGDVLTNAMNVMPAGRFVSPRSGIRAYHGSPYDFDRFDMSKIGSGEGAQAYGHGLYFAENPATAQSYRDTLRQGGQWNKSAQGLATTYLRDAGDPTEALQASSSWLKTIEGNANFSPDRLLMEREANQLLRRHAAGENVLQPNPGKMYEVNINASPEQFLDFDRPLGAQDRQIQNVAQQLIPRRQGYTPDLTGQEAYSIIGQTRGELQQVDYPKGHWERVYNPAGASEALRDAGVPGIRYLDQGSRVNPNWVVRHPQGGINEFPNEAAARAFVARYPEHELEAPKPQTSNYVLFNDKIIDILKKWGLAGMLGGGSVNALSRRDGT